MDGKIIKISTTFMLKTKPSFIIQSFKFCKKSEIVFLPKSNLCALIWKYHELWKSKLGFLDISGKIREISTTFMKSKMMNSTVLLVKSQKESGYVGVARSKMGG